VSKVEAELEERKEFNDKTLNSLVLRLPILMYRMSDAIDRSAIESDIAKALVKNVRARHYQSASGTIPDKEAAAELATQDESAVVDLTRHVYNRLKGKMERADALFDGVRKVITARTTEKTVFGKDKQR
jgi:hypothetical protein